MLSEKNLGKTLEENPNTNLNKIFVSKVKEISACLMSSCYKWGVYKKT
jgi:hypothetical protein